jgi:hypothetical protein
VDFLTVEHSAPRPAAHRPQPFLSLAARCLPTPGRGPHGGGAGHGRFVFPVISEG